MYTIGVRETMDVHAQSRKRVVSVTPLLGAGSAYGNGPRCCLLKLGPLRILVDCGWDSQFKEGPLRILKAAALSKEEPVDLVLLSFGDLEHLGALPVIVGQLGLRVPILATLPTLSMGHQTLYEAFECLPKTQGGAGGAAGVGAAGAGAGSGEGREGGAATTKGLAMPPRVPAARRAAARPSLSTT